MKYIYLLITAIVFFNTDATSQLLYDTGDLFDEIVDVDIAAIPAGDSSNLYIDPSIAQLDKWDEVMVHLLAGAYADAASDANSIDYDLVEFTDGADVFYILRNNSANYWGTYVYNPNHCRSLVIQSPHPKKDFRTGKQGVYVFKATEAIFFCLSGVNRCNSANPSSCSGQTKVCNAGLNNSSENYRISDMAHSTSTIFQKVTAHLFNHFSDGYFISLHGFSKKNSDPYVILSNGTNQTPATDKLPTFKTKLFDEDNTLTFKIAHIDNWTRLVGFTNTQGRLINASINACNNNATVTNGRFIHMEQEKTKLRTNQSGWDKVANALQNTFSCTPLPVETIAPFQAIVFNQKSVKCTWVTGVEVDNAYFEVQRSKRLTDWQKVATIIVTENTFQPKHYQVMDSTPFVGDSYYRLRQVDLDGTSSYSAIRQVNIISKAIKVYPNPAQSNIRIEGLISKFEYFNTYNSLGQAVSDLIDITAQTADFTELDISNLPTGFYFIVSPRGSIKFYKK